MEKCETVSLLSEFNAKTQRCKGAEIHPTQARNPAVIDRRYRSLKRDARFFSFIAGGAGSLVFAGGGVRSARKFFRKKKPYGKVLFVEEKG